MISINQYLGTLKCWVMCTLKFQYVNNTLRQPPHTVQHSHIWMFPALFTWNLRGREQGFRLAEWGLSLLKAASTQIGIGYLGISSLN